MQMDRNKNSQICFSDQIYGLDFDKTENKGLCFTLKWNRAQNMRIAED